MFKLSVLAPLGLAALSQAMSLTVSSSGGKSVSPIFYGLMFEDINHSGDGSLYAELVQNRAFQSGLASWSAIGNVQLSIDGGNALSGALPSSLKVTVPANTSGPVGFKNAGFGGIGVLKQQYKASFYAKSNYGGAFTADVRTNGGAVLGSGTAASASGNTWKQHNVNFTPNAAGDAQNSFAITFDGKAAAGTTLYFNLVSLFPPTFKNRPNGLRVDLANVVNDIGAKYLRFPGGNNIEGNNGPNSRWKWNQTIGPLIDRPGRTGTWGYFNSDGLGLVEYMEWCTDMGLEPLLGVFDGHTLDNTNVDQGFLQPYIDEALDMLEFLMGSTSTTYGAKRASLGYPNPWNIKYVEIGNEDSVGNGMDTYKDYRFQMFYQAISAKYPNVKCIASTIGFPIDTQSGGKAWGDIHNYDTPDHMVSNFHEFDGFSRTTPLIVGEYAIAQPNSPGSNGVVWGNPLMANPSLIGAVAEAVYMLGAEQNADVIMGMSYAPLLQNVDGSQWSPDLISFSPNPADTTRSMSYYVQKLFASNVGTVTLPISGAIQGPIYYSAMAKGSETIVKFANYNGSDTTISVNILGGENNAARWTTFTGPNGLSVNTVGHDNAQLVTTSINGSNGVFTLDLKNLMVGVLVVGGQPATKPPSSLLAS